MVRTTSLMGLIVGAASIVATVASVNGQMPIDDFNDGNDDGWTHVSTAEGETWGPGSFDASTGTYHLETTGLVPVGQLGILGSVWDSSADPFYSEGFWRATIRTKRSGTNAGFTLRWDADADDGYAVYTNSSGGIQIRGVPGLQL